MKNVVRGSQPMPDHIMISINGNPETCMAVTWRTSTDITDGYVLYREDGSDELKRCDAQYHPFVSDIDESHIFSSHLTGLTPDTKYYYTCGNDTYRSEEYSFSTSPEKLTKFKFICVSDQQKGEPFEKPDYSYFQNFIKKVLKDNPDTRFIFTGGDNTDCGQHEVQWNGAFAGLVGICESTPLMMSLGNHDNRGFQDYAKGIGRYYAEPATFFNTQFSGAYPDNGPEGWKTESYSFDYGNAHFCVLSINEPELVNDWVINDIDLNDKTWQFGAYHFPICYSGVDCQNYDAYPVMTECFEKFDVMFSGHEHNFSRSFPLKNENLYDRPSQGTVHYMLGNSGGNPPGSRTVSKIWHSAFYPQEVPNAMVAIVEVDGNKVTLTSMLDDGRIVDKCVIDKDKDEITPYAVAPTFNRTRMLFKGMDPGLMSCATPCKNYDGVWYAALSVLISFVGGTVVKEKGSMTLSAYGHTVTFTEDSDVAITEKGEFKLPAKVIRGEQNQLYVPCDGCHAFDMRWAYADRNNFVSFEHESEAHLVPEQP